MKPGPPRRSLIEKLTGKFDQRGPGECWPWTGSIGASGYGNLTIRRPDGTRGGVQAHRLVYEAFVGPIPNGQQLHHVCRVRACVNPAHLDVVSPAEHKARHPKTHCPQGHPYDEENTFYSVTPSRRCRACNRERARLNRSRRRGM